MPTTLTWHDIGLRLLLTVISAGVVGFDRGEGGRSAGLRTNLLVGLAACFAMIQANWLINSNGKPADSFVVLDLMRLPLGILTGIGFIGAGAIIKRGELIVGVTTAATIWFVTVMGLLYGGGQIGLGVAAFGLAWGTLAVLKRVEDWTPREQGGTLRVSLSAEGPGREQIESILMRGGITLTQPSISYEASAEYPRVFGWKLRWKGKQDSPAQADPPRGVQELAATPGVLKLEFHR